MMTAIVQERYGSPDVLRAATVPRPEPGPGQVLVRVYAASVNARDWHYLRGDPYVARVEMGWRRPKVAVRGTDFAGRVAGIGAGVTDVEIGDEVFGEADGAFAEYVTAPIGVVAPKPTNLSFEQAAALPTAANTALMGIREIGAVRSGQRVLVNGASGGVGLFAVQLAKADGALVTGVCSPRNIDLVREAGADHIVDYTREDFCRAGQRYDVVLDLVANRAVRDLLAILTPAGTLVLSGGGVSTGGSLLGPMGQHIRGMIVGRLGELASRAFKRSVRQRVLELPAKPSRRRLETLRDLAEAGTLRPIIDRSYPLAEAASAIRYLETEHARAKVVLTV